MPRAFVPIGALAAACVLVVLVPGCGGEAPEAGGRTTTTDPGERTTATDPGGTTGGNGGGDPSGGTGTTEDELCDPADWEIGCGELRRGRGWIFLGPDGRAVLCARLELVHVELVPGAGPPLVLPPQTPGLDPGLADAAEEPATGPAETGPEAGTGTEAEATETVRRPRCAAGEPSVPVEGLDVAELENLTAAADGRAAWTSEPVVVEGRFEGGKVVADG